MTGFARGVGLRGQQAAGRACARREHPGRDPAGQILQYREQAMPVRRLTTREQPEESALPGRQLAGAVVVANLQVSDFGRADLLAATATQAVAQVFHGASGERNRGCGYGLHDGDAPARSLAFAAA